MKRHFFNYSFGIIFLSLFLFTACEKVFEVPQLYVPRPDIRGNEISIDILKRYFHPNPGQLDSIRGNIIISGIVVSSDQGGNYYKTLTIQDETGGIEIKINRTSLYNEYRVGQKVFVKCQGLVIGDYGGMEQLGWIYNNGVGQILSNVLGNYLFRDSLPGPEPAPIVITNHAQLAPNMVCRLVEFPDAEFATPGTVFASDSATTNQNLKINGGTVIIRTSSFANFRRNLTPAGKGTVKGVLTVYRGTYQLMLRTIDDVNFTTEN